MSSAYALVPLMMGAISLYVGVSVLSLYLRSRDQVVYLAFAFFVLSTTPYQFATAGLYSAETLSEGIFWQEWQLLYGVIFLTPMLWLSVEFLYREVRRLHRALLSALGIGLLYTTLIWRPIHIDPSGAAVKELDLLFFGRLTLYEGVPAGLTGTLVSGALVVELSIFAFAALQLLRKRGRRELLFFCALSCFALTLLNDYLVFYGAYRSVYLIEYGFQAFTLFISLTLTDEMVTVANMRREQRLLSARLERSSKAEALGRLAGSVAHDLNNVLTPIQGYADLALADTEAGDPIRPDLEEIKAAATRAQALTRHLLAYGKKRPLLAAPHRLCGLLKDQLPLLERLVQSGVSLELACETQARALIDKNQIEELLFDLVSNAVEAMPEGGRVRLELEEARGRIELRVEDTGVGMDEETLERLFDPFFTTKERPDRFGLGLSSAYGIVAQHEGEIEARSALGVGTTITIRLPAYTSSEGGSSTTSGALPST